MANPVNPADPPEAFLTIGAFARTSRLSIKALRLYDEIGLLAPARIDPSSGYRYYAPEQLERARLVAWLRRLGMPLARIRRVCATAETDAAAAAREIGEYWRQVEAETAARRELADFLIAQLSEKETPMAPSIVAPLEIRYAAACDRGLIREENQDAVFAGPRLLAVADGFGGRGAEAGRAAIDALRDLDEHASFDEPATGVAGGELLNLLQDAAARADRAVREIGSDSAGSTLTAMLWTGSRLGLVHIGDSRAYLLRDGGFFQITEDHTLVQSLIEEGRLTPAEAFSHPQRSLLVKALGVAGSELVPQLHVTDVRAGDRYLLCSDGLSAAVTAEKLHAAVQQDGGEEDPAVTVRRLIELSHLAGGSDNVGCVVAHVVVPDQTLAA